MKNTTLFLGIDFLRNRCKTKQKNSQIFAIGRGGGPTRTNLDGDFWEPLIVKKSQFSKNFFTKVMKLVNTRNESWMFEFNNNGVLSLCTIFSSKANKSQKCSKNYQKSHSNLSGLDHLLSLCIAMAKIWFYSHSSRVGDKIWDRHIVGTLDIIWDSLVEFWLFLTIFYL